ncbi:phosphoglycerate dehydrogenase [Rhodohalobacter sp. 614A]|uniref:phosphoglycerate dehydrogenase n=1 Tax=Rhodohalobacter sp. 614A TaxID=2908649 RepID=UPI001F3BCA35|nr:phosphoglycerate dehydrogenase [Rhodohalobacter sp. 614A]
MSFKVLLLDNVDPVCADIFKERGIEADQPPKMELDELKKIIGNYEAVVVRSATTVNEDLLKHADNLQIIGRAGVGVDNIDIPAATQKGVLVMNTPDGNTISTAEHTCGMIIALARNIPQSVEKVKGGGWDRKKYMGTEVHGKTLGIVGLGKIGTEVALRMKAFGMEIVAYDPFTTQDHAKDIGVKLMELDELLGVTDFLTVHTPLTEKTKNMISLENEEKLKPGMRLVNCARGGIYKEEDLPELIEKQIIAGAALDVYTTEPPSEELYEVLKNPAIISTPHLGASTEEAQEKVAVQIASQISDALENKNYKGSLNSKSISLLTNDEVQPYVELAEKLGKVSGQIMPKNASNFSFEYTGVCTKYSEVLTDAVLKGMLAQFVSESVNLINARHYAIERGFKLSETNKSDDKNYNDLITIKLGDSSDYKQISAAVFGPGDYRIVEIDGFGIELRLEGDILMYQNIDKPGMLAAVSSTLAKQNINIGALSLGRTGKGSNAITAVIVDKQLDTEELEAIYELDGVSNVKYISLS